MQNLDERIKSILLADWDPIGVRDVPAVQDEYDQYVPELSGLLAAGASIDQLAERLTRIEVEVLALPADRARADRVARRLLGMVKVDS